MNCVACGEPMLALELEGVEIDHCLACGGIWLDADELEILTGRPEEVQCVLKQPTVDSSHRKSSRRCPICGKKMEEFKSSPDSELYLDRCKKQHGLWFDRGELNEIVRMFDAPQCETVSNLLKNMFDQT
jgi:Zn-finger nucleic acid-binding protein